MRLLLEHPRIPSCAVCQEFMVDYDFHNATGSGRVVTYKGPDGELPDKRPKGAKLPCNRCPKRGPEHEHEYVLSQRNVRLLNFYRGHKATWGKGLSEEAASDPVVQDNFALLDEIYRDQEQGELSKTMGRIVANEISGLFRRR